MPRFSIIVPTYGVEPRLPHALESVLGQRFGDFELIPVHDAAADSPAGAISAAHAARDPRVTPVESPPAGGLSAARNAGLAAAHGTYVLFLDGDDTLAPGALRAIADRVEETGEPDVLYFTHERTHGWEGGGTTVVRPPGPDAPAWSAAYRRDFLNRRQLSFPIGHFTDLGWNGLVALAADRTAELPGTVCVRHVLHWQGSRLDAPGVHHLELLDQVELVLTRAAAGQGLSEALFERLFATVLRSLAHPERLPAHHRRDFFHRATHLYGLHQPPGFQPPAGHLGLQHRLLASGSYAGLRVLHAAHRAAGGVLTALPRARMPLARARYAVQRRLPPDPNLAVYRVHPVRGIGGDLTALYAQACELAPWVRSVFLVTADSVDRVPQGVEHAVLGSPRARRLLARAKYVIDDGDLPEGDDPADYADYADTIDKRPGRVHVRTRPGIRGKVCHADRTAGVPR